LDASDCILAVGTRLAVAAFQPEQQVIHLDVDSAEVGRNHKKSFGLVGEARKTLEAVVERVRKAAPPRATRKDEHSTLREVIVLDDTLEPQSSILKSLPAGGREGARLV